MKSHDGLPSLLLCSCPESPLVGKLLGYTLTNRSWSLLPIGAAQLCPHLHLPGSTRAAPLLPTRTVLLGSIKLRGFGGLICVAVDPSGRKGSLFLQPASPGPRQRTSLLETQSCGRTTGVELSRSPAGTPAVSRGASSPARCLPEGSESPAGRRCAAPQVGDVHPAGSSPHTQSGAPPNTELAAVTFH